MKQADKKIFEVGQKIGLTKKEIDNMLNNMLLINEQNLLSFGPRGYMGSLYGTISIKSF
jgi:ABC-type enterochelin transport system substrate-binding protein